MRAVHEKLAGAATVSMSAGGTPVISMQETATEEVTLTCDTPVALNADADHFTEFWFVLPPTDFTQGFTVTVVDDKEGTFEKSTSNHISLERNMLTRMAPMQVISIGFGSPADIVDLGLSVKWASWNMGATAPHEYGGYYGMGEANVSPVLTTGRLGVTYR